MHLIIRVTLIESRRWSCYSIFSHLRRTFSSKNLKRSLKRLLFKIGRYSKYTILIVLFSRHFTSKCWTCTLRKEKKAANKTNLLFLREFFSFIRSFMRIIIIGKKYNKINLAKISLKTLKALRKTLSLILQLNENYHKIPISLDFLFNSNRWKWGLYHMKTILLHFTLRLIKN